MKRTEVNDYQGIRQESAKMPNGKSAHQRPKSISKIKTLLLLSSSGSQTHFVQVERASNGIADAARPGHVHLLGEVLLALGRVEGQCVDGGMPMADAQGREPARRRPARQVAPQGLDGGALRDARRHKTLLAGSGAHLDEPARQGGGDRNRVD